MRISDWSSDVCSSDLLLELAVRGCYLTPDNNLISYTSVDGIPYTLALSFNRFDKLTDISLKYEREMIDDPDQTMSLEDCRAIHERTADWLVKDFGAFEQKEEKARKSGGEGKRV